MSLGFVRFGQKKRRRKNDDDDDYYVALSIEVANSY